MVQIKIGDNLLDVSEGDDLDIVLNKSIANFDDISARDSTFSFDFKLPPTQNNTQLLFGVSDVNAVFDIGQQAASIIIDGRTFDRGKIFAYESELGGDYTCSYQSGIIDWATELDKVKLNSLEWRSETNSGTTSATETFSSARINTLNGFGYSGGFDLSYPLINRNNGLEVASKRPVIYLRSLIVNMFSKIGWQVDGDWLTSDEITGGITVDDKFGNTFDFNGIVYDPPFNFEVDDDVITASSVGQSTNRSQNGTNPSTWDEDFIWGTRISDSAIITTNGLDGWFNENISGSSSNFDVALNEFTVPSTASYEINFNAGEILAGYFNSGVWNNYNFIVSPFIQAPPKVIFKLIDDGGNVLFEQSSTFAPVTTGFLVNLNLTAGQVITLTGEVLDNAFGFGNPNLNAPSLDSWVLTLNDESSITYQREDTIELNEEFIINAFLPDTNCLDILKDFKITHNLYFETNPLLKKVTINSFNDFYKNIGQAVNFTNKVDLDVTPTINHLSNYAKDVYFAYNKDSEDGYIERWQAIYDRTYGEYRQELIPRDKFNDGSNEFKTEVISATVQGFMEGVSFPTSIIKKEWVDPDDVDINTGYAARIFYSLSGNVRDDLNNSITDSTDLVAVMEPFANIPVPNGWQLTFNGANGLVARNWAKTLATIQLGIRVKLNLLLTKDEFFGFDFSTPIFLEEPTKLKGYYLVESLEEYKLTDIRAFSVKATLIKYKDFVGVDIDTSQSTNINANNLPDNNDLGVDIVYTVTDEGLATETINRVYTIAGNGNINRVII